MLPTWKKVENEQGFPFYFNESTNTKQWDHPKFADIRQRIDDTNYVKYSSYRVALKFRVLQQALHMDQVPLNIIYGVFERHRLGTNESSLCLDPCDLEAVLSDIFFASNKQNHTNIDIDFASELMVNLLYNVYDNNRTGQIQVSSSKLLLGLLSQCQLNELMSFIFSLCADHNNCVTRLRMQLLLTKLTEITKFLHEDAIFGQHLVNSSVESCFSSSPGLVGINEGSFVLWMKSDPQLFTWLPLLFRIRTAETVIHSVKCSSCKISPLMGLRYRCVKCSKYNQCQRCFFTGRTGGTHKLSHSMREYCIDVNRRELNHTLLEKLVSLLSCSKLNDVQMSIRETKPLSSENHFFATKSTSLDLLCNIEPLSSPQNQLQVIIRQLEFQNRELQQIVLLGNHNEKEMRKYLEQHRIHVATQIQKLKILKEYLQVQPNSTKIAPKCTMESTPMVKNGRQFSRIQNLDLLSPIVQMPENESLKSTTVPKNSTYSLGESSLSFSVNDMSTWIGGQKNEPNPSKTSATPVNELHHDLDDALAKLQQILANNFNLDESLGNIDNGQLQFAVSEVEDMLSSIIDNVESSRASSVQPASLMNIPDNHVSQSRL